jgi:hypothetical protein
METEKIKSNIEEEKQCIICNSFFVSHKKLKKYCSKKCKQKSTDKRRMYDEKRILNRRKSSLKYRNKNLKKRRELYKTWSKTPKGRILRRITASLRHKRVKMHTPPWVNQKEIYDIYKKCQEMNEKEKMYSVDHIWPLKGRGFSGLHVPWNLRITTINENSSKGNKRPI